MRYSEMSEVQRRQILDNHENYPLGVRFLNKAGLLTYEELDFLRRNGVDFEVSQRDVNRIEEALLDQGEAPDPPRSSLLRAVFTLFAGLLVALRLGTRHREGEES